MKKTFKNISEDKQERIIEEAMIEFGTYGYEGASTNRLVKTLDISKGSLFKYFEGKLDLYRDLLHMAVDVLLDYMSDFSPTGASAKDRLIEYAQLEFDFLLTHPVIYRFFYKVQQDLSHPDLAAIKEQVIMKAMTVNEKLFNETGIPEDPTFRTHLILVVSGYNRMFMDSVENPEAFPSLREAFIEGLKGHLNLVRWPDTQHKV